MPSVNSKINFLFRSFSFYAFCHPKHSGAHILRGRTLAMETGAHPPLKGIRVLDFTIMLGGPFATMMLGDCGAEVIKIERRGTGDDTRHIGPFSSKDTERKAGGFFLSIGRNKKSVTINLKHPKGIEIAKGLVKKSDVVFENFRPGAMDRLGLGYNELRKINPRIVYTSISGFGHSGPYRDRPSFDLIAQAMGGLMAMTGPRGGAPCKAGPGVGDIWASCIAAYATMVALHHANKTGRGQHVDCAMYDSMLYRIERAVMMYSLAGIVSGRDGNAHPLYAPYDCFEARDGKYVVVAGHWENQWKNLCRAMNREDLLKDPRFSTMWDRAQNYDLLRSLIQTWIAARNREEIISMLVEYDVPVGPVNSVEDIFNCPQVKARQMLSEIHHPIAGPMKIVGVPLKFSETPVGVRRAAPLLGANTEEVLKSILSLSDYEVQTLRDEGAI
jgi:CoA:oxalate CoA-transferase